MKYKLLLLFIIVLLISGCSTVCYDDCISPELVIANNCSNDDNNCKGGNHYCYDLCYGGVVSGLKWFTQNANN